MLGFFDPSAVPIADSSPLGWFDPSFSREFAVVGSAVSGEASVDATSGATALARLALPGAAVDASTSSGSCVGRLALPGALASAGASGSSALGLVGAAGFSVVAGGSGSSSVGRLAGSLVALDAGAGSGSALGRVAGALVVVVVGAGGAVLAGVAGIAGLVVDAGASSLVGAVVGAVAGSAVSAGAGDGSPVAALLLPGLAFFVGLSSDLLGGGVLASPIALVDGVSGSAALGRLSISGAGVFSGLSGDLVGVVSGLLAGAGVLGAISDFVPAGRLAGAIVGVLAGLSGVIVSDDPSALVEGASGAVARGQLLATGAGSGSGLGGLAATIGRLVPGLGSAFAASAASGAPRVLTTRFFSGRAIDVERSSVRSGPIVSATSAIFGVMSGTVVTGSRVRFSAEFRIGGELLDPSSLSIIVQVPGDRGAQPGRATYMYPDAAIVRDGVGRYHLDRLCTRIGATRVQWRSGAVGEEIVVEDLVTVLASSLT